MRRRIEGGVGGGRRKVGGWRRRGIAGGRRRVESGGREDIAICLNEMG